MDISLEHPHPSTAQILLNNKQLAPRMAPASGFPGSPAPCTSLVIDGPLSKLKGRSRQRANTTLTPFGGHCHPPGLPIVTPYANHEKMTPFCDSLHNMLCFFKSLGRRSPPLERPVKLVTIAADRLQSRHIAYRARPTRRCPHPTRSCHIRTVS